jgi:hypothetical protein
VIDDPVNASKPQVEAGMIMPFDDSTRVYLGHDSFVYGSMDECVEAFLALPP